MNPPGQCRRVHFFSGWRTMKELRNLKTGLALLLVICASACGGDDESKSSGNNGNTQPFAPATAAAVTDPNSIYTVNVGGSGSTTLRFPTSGQYQTILNAQTINGTISSLQRNGNTWTATLTPDSNQQGAIAGALTLTWTGKNTGTFTFLPQNAPAQNGTFTVTTGSAGMGDGGIPLPTNGGSNAGGTGGTNSSGGNSLFGKTLQISYQPSGGEKFAFTSTTQASYENGADIATYQYDSSTGLLILTRSGGQAYRLVLAPGSSQGPTLVSYQEPGNVPYTQPATYTLH